jgi:hypothetical protein
MTRATSARRRGGDALWAELERLRLEQAAMRRENAELRALVERVLAGDDPDDPLLTTQEIAALTGRGDEAMRVWFVERKLGRYGRTSRRWRACRSVVIAFLIKSFGLERRRAAGPDFSTMSLVGPKRHFAAPNNNVASLIGR